MEYLMLFIEWTKLKIRIHSAPEKERFFYEREIWWASLGANIGFEQDGKNSKFERPVLIVKKFGKETLWILPLTTKCKTGRYYYQFEYKGKRQSMILSQLRLISSKRLLRKIRTLPADDFEKIRDKLKSFL